MLKRCVISIKGKVLLTKFGRSIQAILAKAYLKDNAETVRDFN